MPTRLIIRGWRRGVLQFTESVDDDHLDLTSLDILAEKHARCLLENGEIVPHMIEMEFLNEPDPLARFARFGTDPTMMVNPVAIELQ